MVVAAFHEIFWILFILYVGGDELNWLGRVPRLGFVVSEEELLHGQVSLALPGLSNTSYVVSLWTGRSSDGPEFGIAHYFWAGPHT